MNKFKSVFAILAGIALLALGGYYLLHHVAKTSTSHQAKYASSYEAHSLGDPFIPLGKDWNGSAWVYQYKLISKADDAVNLIKSQWSGNGYQINQTRPDTADTVYRDLITGDISVMAKVRQTAPDQVGIVVTVSGIDQ